MSSDAILVRLDRLEAGQAKLDSGQTKLEARADRLTILHEDTRNTLQLLAEAVAAMDQRIARRFDAIDRRLKILDNHERRITRLEKRPR